MDNSKIVIISYDHFSSSYRDLAGYTLLYNNEFMYLKDLSALYIELNNLLLKYNLYNKTVSIYLNMVLDDFNIDLVKIIFDRLYFYRHNWQEFLDLYHMNIVLTEKDAQLFGLDIVTYNAEYIKYFDYQTEEMQAEALKQGLEYKKYFKYKDRK